MTKLVLFSEPTDSVLEKLAKEIFTKKEELVAYLPSDGAHPNNPKYNAMWQDFIERNGGTYVFVDNSVRGESAKQEQEKIRNADVLILSGGNTFTFLRHLKESGLDKTISEFSKKDKVIAGFSAGAIILSPTIEIAGLPGFDDNLVELEDLTSLNIIDFDVFPHYEESKHEEIANQYETRIGRTVKRLSDEDLLPVNI